MEANLQTFLDRMQTSPHKMKVKELKEREATWRALWSWIDDDVKDFILHAGTTVRIVRRDYKGFIGELGEVHFEVRELELAVYEKNYNYTDGKYYYERKVVKIPWTAIAWHEFVSSQELAEEAEKYEVEPLAETEEIKA